MTRSKRFKNALEKIDRNKEYSLEDAVATVRENALSTFDESVDLAINLGVDPKNADQNIRMTTSLPHGTGKKVSVLAIVQEHQQKEATEAGADFSGSDEFIEKLESGWDEIDVIVTTPDMMPKLGKLGKILGPRGLMPNPKSGTVAQDVGKAVKEIKGGRVELRVDRHGIIHATIGKCSFDAEKISENVQSVYTSLLKAKPAAVKGTYMKKVSITSTMGPGIKIDKTTI
tara:strand:+ start:1574 stop:2260 length:687 start_codon:yes stop_codon:yes gene_type:complete